MSDNPRSLRERAPLLSRKSCLLPKPGRAKWGHKVMGDSRGMWAYEQWTWWDWRGERLHFRVTRWKEVPHG